MVRPGALRHRVHIERGEPALDADGDSAPVWRHHRTGVWCEVMGVSGNEVTRGLQMQATTTHLVRMRYMPGGESALSPGMRLLHDDRVLNVTSIIDRTGRHRELYLQCMQDDRLRIVASDSFQRVDSSRVGLTDNFLGGGRRLNYLQDTGFSIDANRLKHVSASGVEFAIVDVGLANVVVQAGFGRAREAAGLVVRYEDSQNYVYVVMDPSSSPVSDSSSTAIDGLSSPMLAVRRVLDGTEQTIGAVVIPRFRSGDLIEVECVAASITARHLESGLAASGNEYELVGGTFCGFRGAHTNDGAWFDSLRIEERIDA